MINMVILLLLLSTLHHNQPELLGPVVWIQMPRRCPTQPQHPHNISITTTTAQNPHPQHTQYHPQWAIPLPQPHHLLSSFIYPPFLPLIPTHCMVLSPFTILHTMSHHTQSHHLSHWVRISMPHRHRITTLNDCHEKFGRWNTFSRKLRVTSDCTIVGYALNRSFSKQHWVSMLRSMRRISTIHAQRIAWSSCYHPQTICRDVRSLCRIVNKTPKTTLPHRAFQLKSRIESCSFSLQFVNCIGVGKLFCNMRQRICHFRYIFQPIYLLSISQASSSNFVMYCD
mmetsp:Transcript_10752/g.40227  ORF Transcript_10752/g.40227 Transcript_10752/m.40227 type:complete len:283 (+) Transcript_10752:615-1463(+)